MQSFYCTLCALTCSKTPLEEGENLFCCNGCLTVFRILSAQSFEGNYQTHPLFQQAQISGVISNPHLYDELEKQQVEGESETIHLEIEEMWCPSCAEAIGLILRRQKGVKRCIVDYATDLAVIEYSPRALSKEELFRLIERLGYRPQPILEGERKPKRALWIRFVISAFCALNLMMLALPLYTTHFGLATEGYGEAASFLSSLLALPLMTYCAWPIWRRFFVSLQTGIFGMETLVMIGLVTAFSYSTAHLFSHEPAHTCCACKEGTEDHSAKSLLGFCL